MDDPACGPTFDENSVPPWTRGDFRGFLEPTTWCGLLIRKLTPALRAAPPREGISRGEIHEPPPFSSCSWIGVRRFPGQRGHAAATANYRRASKGQLELYS